MEIVDLSSRESQLLDQKRHTRPVTALKAHVKNGRIVVDVVRDEPATVSARGEISQGTEVGGSSFGIRNCVVR